MDNLHPAMTAALARFAPARINISHQETIANANAYLNDVSLPSYSEVVALLRNAVARLESLDARLLAATGPSECDLGEVTRARAALKRIEG